MVLTQKQWEALKLGRRKGLIKHRPKGLKYIIKKVNPTSFKKGHIPWHKGQKGLTKAWNKGLKGTHFSKKSEWKIGDQIGEKNYKWKGDKVGYAGVHSFIERKLGKPKKCKKCRTIKGRFHWHNISGKYYRDFTDWRRLCTKCHRKEHL